MDLPCSPEPFPGTLNYLRLLLRLSYPQSIFQWSRSCEACSTEHRWLVSYALTAFSSLYYKHSSLVALRKSRCKHANERFSIHKRTFFWCLHTNTHRQNGCCNTTCKHSMEFKRSWLITSPIISPCCWGEVWIIKAHQIALLRASRRTATHTNTHVTGRHTYIRGSTF